MERLYVIDWLAPDGYRTDSLQVRPDRTVLFNGKSQTRHTAALVLTIWRRYVRHIQDTERAELTLERI
jgi:hypothetical protein